MASIKNAMVLEDKMSSAIRTINKNLSSMLTQLEKIDKKMQGGNTATFKAMREDVRRANQEIKQMEDHMKRASNQAGNLKTKLGGFQGFSVNLSGVRNLLDAMRQITYEVGKFINANDKLLAIQARLNLVSDGTMRQSEFQRSVFDLANRTRSDIEGTAKLVTRLGLSGSPAFKTSKQALEFTEQFNKLLIISGTTKEENAASLHQLAQAMGSNRLQGDEFRSLAEQAPMFQMMLARGMGVGVGTLKERAKKGELTATVIAEAIMKMRGETDKLFADIPMRFGQVMTQVQNEMTWLMQRFSPVMQILITEGSKFFNWLSSAQAVKTFDIMAGAMSLVLGTLININSIVYPMFSFVVDNAEQVSWILSMISGSVFGILTYLGVTRGVMLLITAAQWAWNIAANTNPYALILGLLGLAVGHLVYLYNTSLAIRIEIMRWKLALHEFMDAVLLLGAYVLQPIGIIGSAIADIILAPVNIIKTIADGIFNAAIWTYNKLTGNDLQYVDINSKLGNYFKGREEHYRNLFNFGSNTENLLGMNAMKRNADFKTWQQAEIDKEARKMIVNDPMKAGMAGKNGAVPVEVVNDVGLKNEDIRWLSDLALREFAINYRNVTPIVNANFGDIHENADVNRILDQIEEKIIEVSSTSLGG